MFNVRSALNNMFVVDPHYVEMQDLKDPGPGKFIRLKQAAMGRDVRTVLNQLSVQDVTASHIDNVSAFMRLGDILSGVNDSLKGVQPGGRRSATESRITSESGASRQAALARMISAQGMTELAEMQASNVQQYQSMEFYLKIVGAEGLLVPIKPDDVQGNFYFPIHDGALPLDRVALLDVWKEIWMAVATNPQLAMQYNGPAIFEYMANLAGAKNLTSVSRSRLRHPWGCHSRVGIQTQKEFQSMPDFLAYVEEMALRPPPEDLGKQLRVHINSDSPVMYALARVLKQATELSKGLATIDFTTDEGRLKAIRQQGVIEGLVMAVELVLAPAQEEANGGP